MDRRILHTKRLLRDTLLTMLCEKPLEAITPTELCRRATVNRNTFYRYYAKPLDVLREAEDELVATIKERLQESGDSFENLVSVCEQIKEDRLLSEVLLLHHPDPAYWARIREIAKDQTNSQIDTQTPRNDDPPQFSRWVSTYTMAGATAIIEQWVKDGMREDPRTVARFIFDMSHHGFHHYNSGHDLQ